MLANAAGKNLDIVEPKKVDLVDAADVGGVACPLTVDGVVGAVSVHGEAGSGSSGGNEAAIDECCWCRPPVKRARSPLLADSRFEAAVAEECLREEAFGKVACASVVDGPAVIVVVVVIDMEFMDAAAATSHVPSRSQPALRILTCGTRQERKMRTN